MYAETPLDIAADLLALLGAVLVVAGAGFFRPEPTDWREAMITPFWKQREQFRKPGFHLFTGGLGLVSLRLLLSLMNKVMAGL